jgi:ubiquinone/menaquinone biosynthesis C-methylase UbiE
MSAPEPVPHPVRRSRKAVQSSYDRLSGWYDLIAGAGEKRFREAGLKKLGVAAGKKVLEIGVGTGESLVALARSAGDGGKVYGVDISPGMIEVAFDKIQRKSPFNNAGLFLGDGTNLPFASSSFDAVCMSFTLELFDDPGMVQVLLECRRVLKEGGRLSVVAMSGKKTTVLIRIYEWFHEKFPDIIDCRPIDAETVVKAGGFLVKDASLMSMWGLPVEIVLAVKQQGDDS